MHEYFVFSDCNFVERVVMSNDKFFADDYVHLLPDGLFDNRVKIEKALRALSGVFSVHSDTDELRHAIFIAYNPEVVASETLLKVIRKSYAKAVKVASILMRVRS